jgi:hypothetical protein
VWREIKNDMKWHVNTCSIYEEKYKRPKVECSSQGSKEVPFQILARAYACTWTRGPITSPKTLNTIQNTEMRIKVCFLEKKSHVLEHIHRVHHQISSMNKFPPKSTKSISLERSLNVHQQYLIN